MSFLVVVFNVVHLSENILNDEIRVSRYHTRTLYGTTSSVRKEKALAKGGLSAFSLSPEDHEINAQALLQTALRLLLAMLLKKGKTSPFSRTVCHSTAYT